MSTGKKVPVPKYSFFYRVDSLLPEGSLRKALLEPVHGEILIKRPSGAEPSHDNRLASDSVQSWPEAVLNPRLSHPGYYRANLGALGIC
jgi:hypothetical protein